LWADFDTFALVLVGLSAREACQAMVVCPAWKRWGPELVRVARWAGHPAARALRSRPSGRSWRSLHLAETWLLCEDFTHGDAPRWQPVFSTSGIELDACTNGLVSAGGEESLPGAPLVAVALSCEAPRACRPQKLQVRLRCRPKVPWGRCSAYVIVGDSHASSVVGTREVNKTAFGHVAACAFISLASTWRRDFGRRVTGLFGGSTGETSPPYIDADVRIEDPVKLEIQLKWGLCCVEGTSLQIGSFGHVTGVGSGGPAAVSHILLGAGPGSHVDFLQVHMC